MNERDADPILWIAIFVVGLTLLVILGLAINQIVLSYPWKLK